MRSKVWVTSVIFDIMSSRTDPISPSADGASSNDDLNRRVRDAIALLEGLASDRDRLLLVSETERNRLLRAAGEVSRPDAVMRRQLVKATKRLRKAQHKVRIEEIEAQLTETGIRQLRRQPVFTTPNYRLPAGDAGAPGSGAPLDAIEEREAIDSQHCYTCKRHFTVLHHFYDQLCTACGDFNYSKRTETADLGGRVALLRRARQDRLPGGDQAPPGGRASHRHYALSS